MVRRILPTDRKPKPTFAYDPTGFRTAKSATDENEIAALAKIVPDHFPKPEWVDKLEEINAANAKKGIPFTLGRRYKYNYRSEGYNKISW